MADVNDLFEMIITDAGRDAIINAATTGISNRIARIGFGDARYNTRDADGNPLPEILAQVSLQNERDSADLGIAFKRDGVAVMAGTLPASLPEFPIGEISAYLEDGTMFCVGSNADRFLTERTELAPTDFELQLALVGVDADKVEFIVRDEGNVQQLIDLVDQLQANLNSKADVSQLAALTSLINQKAPIDHTHGGHDQITTNSDTITTLSTIQLAEGEAVVVNAIGVGVADSVDDALPFKILCSARRQNGETRIYNDQIRQLIFPDLSHDRGFDAGFTVDAITNDLLLQVQGASGVSVRWSVEYSILRQI